MRVIQLCWLQPAYFLNDLSSMKVVCFVNLLILGQIALWSLQKFPVLVLHHHGRKFNKKMSTYFNSQHLFLFISFLFCGLVPNISRKFLLSFPQARKWFAKHLKISLGSFLHCHCWHSFRWYTKFCRSAWNHNACKEKKIKIDFKGQLWHGQLIIKTVF